MKVTLLGLFAPLQAVNPIVYTIIISLVPLIELRGAIPVAIAMGMNWFEALLWSVIGSMIPALFIIPLFAWALDWLKHKGWLPWLTTWLDRKFVTKAEQVSCQVNDIDCSDKKDWQKELLKFWAIVIFVGIPLPGTGVYTGAAIASIIKMPFPKAFAAVLVGDIIAGIIMVLISLTGKEVL